MDFGKKSLLNFVKIKSQKNYVSILVQSLFQVAFVVIKNIGRSIKCPVLFLVPKTLIDDRVLYSFCTEKRVHLTLRSLAYLKVIFI